VSQIMSSSEFTGKIVLVTGASSGIGLATAELLHANGATVLLVARSFPEPMPALGHSERFCADVRSRQDLQRVARAIQQHHDGLDGLFVNAGVAEFVALDDADDAHFQRVMDTNVKGAFLSTQCLAPLLREGASVVFTSSVSAAVGSPWCSVYSASKGAVEAMARSLAAELLDRHVRVNCVSPGPTETPILVKSAVSESGLLKLGPFVMQRMRMGRLGRASEVAEAAAFLLSSRSSFITGQTLAVDGGLSGI
jgi:NAD(P)-dependent dehydrogenase (short-subunit alcohol dehydrogenase family)